MNGHVRHMYVKFVFNPFTSLWNIDNRRSNITETADEAFVVEAAIGKQKIDYEGIDF